MQKKPSHPRQRGGMAVTVAAMLPVLIIGSGAGIDYMRYADAKARLQNVVDQAALAAAKRPNASLDDMTKWTKVAASVNLPKGFVLDPVPALVADPTAVNFTLSGKLNTTLMRFVGVNWMKISVTAKAQRAQNGPLELVLALDYTNSMADPPPGGGDAKIKTLRQAAIDLVTPVMTNNSAAVGLVPFADWINIGTSYNGQSWLTLPEKMVRYEKEPYLIRYDPCPTDGKPDGKCPVFGFKEPAREVTRYFSGCVALRPVGYQETLDRPDLHPYLGNVMDCSPVRPIIELTTRNEGGSGKGWDKINRALTNLDTTNHNYTVETLIPSGLTWGWNMLTAAQPLEKAMTKEAASQLGARKVLLLMTDGSNSLMTYANGQLPVDEPRRLHPQQEIDDANKLTAKLCENIKLDGITIYTVGFGIPDNKTLDMLKACANTPADGLQYYFDAQSNEQLKLAFAQIGAQLAQPRLLQ